MTQCALIISCWLLRVLFFFNPPPLQKSKNLIISLGKGKVGGWLGWAGLDLVTDQMLRLPRKAGRRIVPWIPDAGLCVHIVQGTSCFSATLLRAKDVSPLVSQGACFKYRSGLLSPFLFSRALSPAGLSSKVDGAAPLLHQSVAVSRQTFSLLLESW